MKTPIKCLWTRDGTTTEVQKTYERLQLLQCSLFFQEQTVLFALKCPTYPEGFLFILKMNLFQALQIPIWASDEQMSAKCMFISLLNKIRQCDLTSTWMTMTQINKVVKIMKKMSHLLLNLTSHCRKVTNSPKDNKRLHNPLTMLYLQIFIVNLKPNNSKSSLWTGRSWKADLISTLAISQLLPNEIMASTTLS